MNKMTQKNKQSFSAFISGFEKKMLETGKCYDLSLTGRFAGNVCQNLGLAVWANVRNVQAHWERSRRVRRSQTFLTFHPIYIYLVTSQIDSFLL